VTYDLACAYPRLGWFDKLVTVLTWTCAVAIFATVGWMTISPNDPRGAVSVSIGQVPAVIPQVAALAAAVAGIVTAVIGRKLPDVGTFAVAVGLAGANLQGSPSSYLLTHVVGPDAAARQGLCVALAVEGLVWFLVIVVAGVVSGAVMRWCHGRPHGEGACADGRLASLAVADVPVLGEILCGPAALSGRLSPRIGLLHGGVTALVALFLIRVLATGSPERTIQHGQVYFSVAAAFYLGAYAAHRAFPVRTPLWSCLAVPVVCVVGYMWTMMRAGGTGPYAQIASVPPTVFLRALPLEYISVGTAAVVALFWSRPHVHERPKPKDRASSR
jgi:hypothetical protein